MSSTTHTSVKKAQTYVVVKPPSKRSCAEHLKRLREKSYMLLDSTARGIWLALGNRIVYILYPEQKRTSVKTICF